MRQRSLNVRTNCLHEVLFGIVGSSTYFVGAGSSSGHSTSSHREEAAAPEHHLDRRPRAFARSASAARTWGLARRVTVRSFDFNAGTKLAGIYPASARQPVEVRAYRIIGLGALL